MAVAVVLLAVGISILLTGGGYLRFVPGLEQPGDATAGWRQRFGIDPSRRTRAKVVIALIGATVLLAGIVALLVAFSVQ